MAAPRSEAASSADANNVRVAIRIRPQLHKELVDMCRVCTNVTPGEPQITLGKDKAFTFDFCYDIDCTQEHVYNTSVQNLVEGCFEGYNATVLAYGQTGAGKTHTMGTGFDVNVVEADLGVIPRAVRHLFEGIERRREEAVEARLPPPDFKINAQFMELYNEDIIDLFDSATTGSRIKSNVKIHEDATGGIYCVGVTTRAVSSVAETMQCLHLGALSRTTASTNMNAQSSRSHAIFSLHIRQQRLSKTDPEDGEESKDSQPLNEFETLSAKFHFVDLAGSERLKRTGATGDRAKEGISINCGLLALGNVISALGDKSKKGSHVPYRDSKLTRLLQDSLGGNSRTLMIACISPSDRDFMETLNTLKYANRAKNIKNRISVNQDKTSQQLAALRAEVNRLQEELLEYKTGKRLIDADGVEGYNDLFHENTMLQTENNALRERIKVLQETADGLRVHNVQLLADMEVLKMKKADMGENAEDAEEMEQMTAVVRKYVEEIEELRSKLLESEAMHKRAQLRSQTSPFRANSSMSMVGFSGTFDLSQSRDEEELESVLVEAKKDVKMKQKKVKKKIMVVPVGLDQVEEEGEDKTDMDLENEHARSQSECSEAMSEYDEIIVIDEEEENEEEEEMQEEQIESEDEDDDDSNTEESDRIQDDLAEITNEISLKQRLIEQLEMQQRKMALMQSNYEEKIIQLQTMIKATSQERDEVLASVSNLSSQSQEKVENIKADYDKRLSNMQLDIKKLEAAKKEHEKLLRNKTQHEKQLHQLQRELKDMKTTKVKLMQQMKVESAKMKENEAKRQREFNRLKKDKDSKDRRIRTLEDEKRQRDLILKRKQEEVNALRRQVKPVSGSLPGTQRNSTTSLASTPSVSTSRLQNASDNVSKSMQKKHTSESDLFASRGNKPRTTTAVLQKRTKTGAKLKWQNIEKNIMNIVKKKQTIANMEKEMERWVSSREKLSKRLEKLKKKMEALQGVKSQIARDAESEIIDQIESVQDNINFVQDNISECQDAIMQLEESKSEGEDVSVSKLINAVNLEEARYLLESFLVFAIDKGLEASQKEASAKGLEAELVQTRQNNVLQQQLLQYMIQDKTDLEVDNIFSYEENCNENVGVPGSSMASSRSASPTDSKMMLHEMEDISQTTHAPLINGGPPSMIFSQIQRRNSKARRKTATTQDLLGMGDSDMALPMIEDETEPDLANFKSHPPEHHVNAFVTTLSLPPIEDSQPQNDLSSVTSVRTASSVSDSLILAPRSISDQSPSQLSVSKPLLGHRKPVNVSSESCPGADLQKFSSHGLPSRNSALSGTFDLLRRSHSVENNSVPKISHDAASFQLEDSSASKLDENLARKQLGGSYTVLNRPSPSKLSGFSKNLTSKVLNLLNPSSHNGSSGSTSSSTSSINENPLPPSSSASSASSGMASKPVLPNPRSAPERHTERSSRTPGREVTVPDREVSHKNSNSSLARARSSSNNSEKRSMPPPPPISNPPTSAPMTRSFPGPGLGAKGRSSGGKGGVALSSPSPRLRRKAGSGQNLTQIHPSSSNNNNNNNVNARSNDSWATSSVEGGLTNATPEATPPPSPSAFRRGNVFARLSGRAARNSVADSGKGIIRPHVSTDNVRNAGVSGPSPFLRQSSNSSSSTVLNCLHVAEGHAKAVLSVDATNDRMFSGSKDRVAKVWDLTTGHEISSLTGHPNNVTCVKFAPDSKLLFTLSLVYIKVWDLRSQTCIKTLNSSGLINDGHPPLSTSTRTNVVPHGESLINSVSLSCTAAPLLYAASGSAVRIWDLRRFASVSRLSTGSKTDVLSILTGPSLNSLKNRSGPQPETPQGHTVVIGSRDHTVKLYDVPADPQGVLSARHTLHPPHYDGVQCLAMTRVKSAAKKSTSGRTAYLFTGSRDCHIKKWDLTSVDLVATQNNAHKDWVSDLAIPPVAWRNRAAAPPGEEEGDLLVSACRSGALRLWDVGAGGFNLLSQEETAHPKSIAALAVNDDNLFTASADGTLRIWNLG